jgi:DNA-binding NtrC family response regulator
VSLATASLLVVEDNATLRRAIVRALAGRCERIEEAEDCAAARERIARADDAFSVVITDLRLPDGSGLEVLRAARARDTRSAVVLMTAHGSVEAAVEAMREGAVDFLQKPFELAELEARAQRAASHARLVGEVAELRAERGARQSRGALIGRHPGFVAAIELAQRVAPTRATVLITGQTGTGKELIAGLVHTASPRAEGPFVKVNCAALPETLLESELFGHERGAFTSADRQRVGRFEQASGGTLFLDEIGDVSLATQAKLLRVLQDQEFHRLGGTRSLRTDARVVAATNKDLRRAIAAGEFREDLYFRVNVITIELPSLRERADDVDALAQHFLAEFAAELGRPRSGFSAAALARIRAHDWPGNVRELRNVIERAVLMGDGPGVEAGELAIGPSLAAQGRGSWRPQLPPAGLALDDAVQALVLEALERSGWVQKEAADWLRISRRKLNYMIQRMGITHATWRRNRDTD